MTRTSPIAHHTNQPPAGRRDADTRPAGPQFWPHLRRSRQLPVAIFAAVTLILAGVVTACAAGGNGSRAAARALHPPRLPACLPACLVASRVPCYAQDPLHRVYGLGQLYARGTTGAGTTVAVIDDGANPQARADLAAFSRFFRLPPAWLRALPWGKGAPGPA